MSSTKTSKATKATKPAARATKTERVAAQLRERITSGQLPPAALLPSETELINTYGVSRITARAAIAALRTEGLVQVIQGKGAFVRRVGEGTHNYQRGIHKTPDGYSDPDTDSFADAVNLEGDRVWREIEKPATYHVNATATLALHIGIAEHSPLFGTDRLLEDTTGRRVLHRTYVPFQTITDDAPTLEEDPFIPPTAIYRALSDSGRQLKWTESVSARNPTPDDAKALHIPAGIPMLVTRRLTTTHSGRPLIMEETHRSAEDTQLTYTLTPTHPN